MACCFTRCGGGAKLINKSRKLADPAPPTAALPSPIDTLLVKFTNATGKKLLAVVEAKEVGYD